MSRGLSTDQNTALASGKLHLVTMLKLSLGSTFYYTNHYKNIVYDSNTYLSSAFILDISQIREESSMTNGSIDLTLSAVTTTLLTDLLSNGHIGKDVVVYLSLLNSDGAIITNPIQIFEGQTSGFKFQENAKTSEIVLTVGNHWTKIKEFSGRRLTDQSQQLVFTGDLSMEFRDQIGKKITWGTQE